jgi:hypothetical protein
MCFGIKSGIRTLNKKHCSSPLSTKALIFFPCSVSLRNIHGSWSHQGLLGLASKTRTCVLTAAKFVGNRSQRGILTSIPHYATFKEIAELRSLLKTLETKTKDSSLQRCGFHLYSLLLLCSKLRALSFLCKYNVFRSASLPHLT